MSTDPNIHWLSRDHVLVVQAARNLPDSPLYARQLWDEAEDPIRASLQLLDLLMRERVGPLIGEGSHRDD
jgi:hypothetical protein